MAKDDSHRPCSPEQMLWAYANGLFPMAMDADAQDLHWFDPHERGILPVGGVHLSRSMARHLRRAGWQATLNRDFEAVIDGCAAREETWINPALRGLYGALHDAGHAHSLEIREAGGALIGGVFGISLGAAFFGESMYSARPNASKAALLWLSDLLARAGFVLLDTQYPTPHLASMGGQTISRTDYHRRLAAALRRAPRDLRDMPLPEARHLVQAITQTS